MRLIKAAEAQPDSSIQTPFEITELVTLILKSTLQETIQSL